MSVATRGVTIDLSLPGAAVSKHVASIFLKLGFSPDGDNRRVKAILEWFEHR